MILSLNLVPFRVCNAQKQFHIEKILQLNRLNSNLRCQSQVKNVKSVRNKIDSPFERLHELDMFCSDQSFSKSFLL